MQFPLVTIGTCAALQQKDGTFDMRALSEELYRWVQELNLNIQGYVEWWGYEEEQEELNDILLASLEAFSIISILALRGQRIDKEQFVEELQCAQDALSYCLEQLNEITSRTPFEPFHESEVEGAELNHTLSQLAGKTHIGLS